MKTKSKSILRKLTTYIMVLVTVCGTFLTNPTSVSASELVLNEPTEYSYTGVSPHLGYAITHNPIYLMKMDVKKVLCVESGIFTTTGGGYIPEGTTVTVIEVTAPNGYFNKGEIKKVVIKPNETVKVTLNNKEQLGQVLLAKTGKEFGTTMFNQYYSLKGAVYGIYKEDGTKVTTITTDEYGKAISSNINLGKYYALEKQLQQVMY